MKILVWGAGNNGHVYRKYLEEKTDYEFLGYIDNNSRGAGRIHPSEISNYNYDYIVVSNQYTKDRAEIKAQLMNMSIDMGKVIFLVENAELKEKVFSTVNRYDEEKDRRVVWLAAFAHYVKLKKIQGNVAECGVNLGEFAYYINKYFSDRKFYLFDTFEGFPERDMQIERKLSGDVFADSVYNTRDCFKVTNIDIVKNRMLHINQCEFHVGYFPESAKGVADKFCFVNLDTDLYQSILSGLEFFYPQMVDGGVILIHDFFNVKLPGVERAIKDYEESNDIVLHKFPIADYLSLAVVK